MTVKVKCVHCGTMVHEFTAECPNCHKPVANKDAPVNVTPSPWQKRNIDHGKKFPLIPVVIVLLVIAAAVIIFILKK